MADEILIKVRADVDGFKADMDEAKKIGNAAIQDIEKNDLFGKANTNAQELKKALELIAKTSRNVKLDGLNIDELVGDTTQLKKLIDSLSQSLKGMKAGTTEFKALDAIIKSANTQITSLSVNTEKVGKSLKAQMREAQNEVGLLAQKFGATSKEATAAALRAAELKDTIDDVNDAINAGKGGGVFTATAKAVGSVASGFSAVQGAMALVGSESEDVQKAILKVQGAMALAQGLQGLEDAGRAFSQMKAVALDAFKSIRAAIGSTGIGLLVIALGTVVAYWDDIKEAISGVSQKQRDLLKTSEDNVKSSKNKLDLLTAQEATLKLQGVSEKEIIKIRLQAVREDNIANRKKLEAVWAIEDAEAASAAKRRKALVEYLGFLGTIINSAIDGNSSQQEAKIQKDRLEQRKVTLAKLQGEEDKIALQLRDLDKKDKEQKIKSSKEVKEAKIADEKELNSERLKFNAAMNEKELQGLADKKKAEKDEFQNSLDDLNQYLEDEDKLKKIYAKREDERKKEILDKQKQALNDLLDFAQNGILLQIGLNPQDVARLRDSITSLVDKIQNDIPINAKDIAETAGNAYFAVSNAIAANDAQKRQEELAALQVQQEEELRLAGDNEQKKDIIRQKYALKEREIKRKQAEADKKKAIFDAVVGTAVAVVKAAPNPILMAITAALGAAQIALIAATPIPKFAKGVVSFDGKGGLVKGEGTGTSDSNLAYLSRGESVIPAEPTSANLGLINELVNGDVDSYINRHYVLPALQAKESKASESYRHSMIEAENNLIARMSGHTLKSIHKEQRNTTEAIKRLDKKNYSW